MNDLSFLFEQLASVRAVDEERTGVLRHRYLTLLLDALGTRPPLRSWAWGEIRRRWS